MMEGLKPRKWTNRPVKSRSKMISFRVSLDELAALEVEAGRRQVSLSDLLRLALERLFGNSMSQ
jgi:hypothetical protein